MHTNRRTALSVLALSVALATTGLAKQPPEKAVANLDVGEGLETTLFASEPMMLSPSSFDIDHLGRIWVCEVVNYRGHRNKRQEGDRILVLDGGSVVEEGTHDELLVKGGKFSLLSGVNE